MNLSFVINEIKGYANTKDGTPFYKVSLHDTWIPGGLLQAHQDQLLKQFLNFKIKCKTSAEKNNDEVSCERKCCICFTTVANDVLLHEEQHIKSSKTEEEVLCSFKNVNETGKHILQVQSVNNINNVVGEKCEIKDGEPQQITNETKQLLSNNENKQMPDAFKEIEILSASVNNSHQSMLKPREDADAQSREDADTQSQKDADTQSQHNVKNPLNKVVLNSELNSALPKNLEAYSNLLQNIEYNQSKHISCDPCQIKFENLSTYKNHMTEVHTQTYFNCKHCSKTFVTKDIFSNHLKLHKNSNRLHKFYENKRLSKTTKEGESATDATMYDKNNRVEISNHLIERPRTKRNIRARWSQEMEFTPEVLKNAKRYIKSVSLLRKKKSLLRTRNQFVTPASKGSKGTLFENIGVDLELKETEESFPIVAMDKRGRTSYTCKVCQRTFFNKFHHREHYNTHSGETPYECEFCGKKFAQRSGWNRHIKLHHKYEVFSGPIDREIIMNHKVVHVFSSQDSVSQPPPNRYLSTNNNLPLPQNMLRAEEQSLPTMARCHLSKPLSNENHYPNQPTTPGIQMMMSPGLPSASNNHSFIPSFTSHSVSPPNESLSTPPSNTPLSSVEKVNEFLSTHIDGGVIKENMNKVINQNNPSNVVGKYMFVNRGANEGTVDNTNKPKVSSPGKEQYKYMFQCKKVQTMNGEVIFMVRLAGSSEYAYILDNHGLVKSRIYVDESPGSAEWLEFPLDETTDSVLLKRVQSYDTLNKRGQKPGATSFKFTSKFNIYNIDKNVSSGNETADDTSEQNGGEESSAGRKFKSGRLKKFSCPICSRKFLAQAHVNSHMLIHTGEFPYKCMFCGRPFRHKSGLNSHHKRHFQRGIFNKPICGNKTYKAQKPRERTESNDVIETISSYEKDDQFTKQNKIVPDLAELQELLMPKRKGRPPKNRNKLAKQVKKAVQPVIEPELHDDEEEININNNEMVTSPVEGFERDVISFDDALALFECHFCSMKFTMKEAYLNHIESHHENNNTVTKTEDESEFIKFDDFNEDVISDVNVTPDNDVLFADVQIKEEVVDV